MAPADTNTAAEGMQELILTFWHARAVAAAAQLGIPDAMGDAPATSAAIAERVGADPHAVLRLLRALAAIGVCAHRGDGAFELTEIGRMLRTDVPESVHGHAAHIGSRVWSMFDGLDEMVRSGGRAGGDDGAGFDELMNDPVGRAAFYASLSNHSMRIANALMEVYDFSRFRTVVDVGGGFGGFLRPLFDKYPGMTGQVLDLPVLAEDARRYIAEAGLAERVAFVGGDFFAEVPAGADAYVLKYILHDWDDDHAVRILEACREAAGANGSVLLVEHVVPDRVSDAPADRMVVGSDLVMMGYGGMERTVKEFSDLFARADLTLFQVSPAARDFCVLEGVAAGRTPEEIPAREREAVDAETSDRETA